MLDKRYTHLAYFSSFLYQICVTAITSQEQVSVLGSRKSLPIYCSCSASLSPNPFTAVALLHCLQNISRGFLGEHPAKSPTASFSNCETATYSTLYKIILSNTWKFEHTETYHLLPLTKSFKFFQPFQRKIIVIHTHIYISLSSLFFLSGGPPCFILSYLLRGSWSPSCPCLSTVQLKGTK